MIAPLRLLATGILVLAGFHSTWAAVCDLDLTNPIAVPANPQRPADTVKHAYRLSDQSVVFRGRFTIDADGDPRAYGPNNSGLDHTANAGHPGNWWALATDAPQCGRTGAPIVQGPNDPAPGFYVAPTTMRGGTNCRNPRIYVNSGDIPYVALPPAVANITDGRGRLAVVLNTSNGRIGYALHADGAPRHGIGEGSIALARELGLDPNPRRGGTDRRSLVFIILPQRAGFPANADDVRTQSRLAFNAWGGKARLEACRHAVWAAPL